MQTDVEKKILDKPLISVIVPVYNVEKYLKQCVDSIRNQSYKNLEIILVDDGSSDRCPQMCDKFASEDDRIRVIHKENSGVSDSRNKGLDNAKGEIIGFVDGDDYIDSEMYKSMIRLVIEEKVDMVICGTEKVNCAGKSLGKFFLMDDAVYKGVDLLRKLSYPDDGGYVVSWNKIYRKRLFDETRFPSGKIYEDQSIIHELYFEADIVATISKNYYFYRQRKGSYTHIRKDLTAFDFVDALYNRMNFYIRNGFDDLLPQLWIRTEDEYICARGRIFFQNHSLRIIETDQKYLAMYNTILKKDKKQKNIFFLRLYILYYWIVKYAKKIYYSISKEKNV